MNVIKTFFAVAVIACIGMSFTKLADWVLYSSKTFGYQASFPYKPSENKETINSAVGLLVMNTATAEPPENAKDSNFVYMSIYTEYPKTFIDADSLNKASTATFFKGVIDGTVKSVKGKLLTEKTIDINGFPGKEVRIDFQNGVAVITQRCYLVHNKMYVLQIICEPSNEKNMAKARFLNSLKLLN